VDNQPTVSIVTPTFNSQQFIDETIASVVNQTFHGWELILVDDGSTDSTVDHINTWRKKDPRIRLLTNEQNLGPGPSRNYAVKTSRGRYIAYLDSDDIWLPKKLETQLDHLKANDATFSFTSYEMIDEESKLLGRQVIAPQKLSYDDLLKNTVIGCLTVMIDSSKSPPLTMPSIPSRQPLVLWLQILKETGPAVGLDEILARYRVRAGSISSNKVQAAKQVWRVYREYEHLTFPTAFRYFLSYAFRASLKNIGLRRR
jgi:teichuronic acid biosynthesis glycosyltransferase TuaG